MMLAHFKPFSPSKQLAWILILSCCLASQNGNGDKYTIDACSVTPYRDLCVRSLASFSNEAKQDPSKWARAGVSVTIGEAKKVARSLANLKQNGSRGFVARARDRMAIADCVECFQDALDNLHESLDVLRNLSVVQFGSQMEDVITWISAALTDEDTCLDGFDQEKGKHLAFVLNCVSKTSYMTSNALALVNKLATTGPGSLAYGLKHRRR
ncbi:pectinesterase inhibitor 6-like isoform X2 [Henckelia pumila]|uniref:pectinesterase inhibitor 6-like isoform X2 n=1 Tax=Henckelia pumila TaxID=405737 RepID=UPI003C6E979C